MSFFRKRIEYREWWLGIGPDRSSVTYRHGNHCNLLTLSNGFGPGSSGSTFGSPLEWTGNLKSIKKCLQQSNAEWFLQFLEKGISELPIDETEILDAFEDHYGFQPIQVVPNEFPFHLFNKTVSDR